MLAKVFPRGREIGECASLAIEDNGRDLLTVLLILELYQPLTNHYDSHEPHLHQFVLFIDTNNSNLGGEERKTWNTRIISTL